MVNWADDNPFYLLIVQDETQLTTIDLGEFGWSKTYKKLMRQPAEWYLVRKDSQAIPISMVVRQGEQPYYVCRHIGVAGSGGGNEVKAYGIGKKRKVGSRWQTDRLWVLENGQVCGGDDVEPFALKLLQQRGPA